MNQLRIYHVAFILTLLLILTVACTTDDVPSSEVGENSSNETGSPERNTSGNAIPAANPNPTSDNIISLDSSITYQTMRGWEGVAQIGQTCPDCAPIIHLWRDQVADRAANELGLNRIRLEVRSGAENPTDYYQRKLSDPNTHGDWLDHFYDSINDNNNPNSINWNGFQFTELDHAIDNAVLPLKQTVEANGEKLYVNLNYVDFDASSFEHQNNPDEYAEFILATFIHMRDKYGFVPDGVEIILEPDNSSGWSGTQIGQVIVATGDRLSSEGFATPDFIGPSTKQASTSLTFLDEMIEVQGVSQYLTELAYHRYGKRPGDSDLRKIRDRASKLGIDTSMLEKIGASYDKLHEDIKYGNVSSWQQYTISFPGSSDSGGAYYVIDRSNLSNVKVNLGSRSAYLAQYFRHVRSGAQRIDAGSSTGNLDPLAFINTNGNYVVVVKAEKGRDFSILGLPAGTYGISYSVGKGIQASKDITISAGQALNTEIPDEGVISIFAKTTP